jgi:hypothetical protein
MGFFDATQEALARGQSVFFGELYELGLTSGTVRYWDGFGDISAYGLTWIGRGQFVQRSEIPFGVDDEAGAITLTLSGVDAAIVAAVRAEEAEFYQRPITIWGQFFGEDLQLSGTRFHLFTGTMDVPTYGGTGVKGRSVIIPAEGEWSDRNGAAFEFFTNASQQARYPGDKGLEYVYRYNPGVKRMWPDFTP